MFMNELVGFGRPNDLAAVVLRAKLARFYGIFGITPMWGGQRLHEFYPPLASVITRYFTMAGALTLYFLLCFATWGLGKDIITAVLFLVSFFHIVPTVYVGRFPEALGYLCLTMACFAPNDLVSGAFIGFAALSHPIPGVVGTLILATRGSVNLYLVEAIVCGWWYIPFFLKRKKLSYLYENRRDKILGIYVYSYMLMFNEIIFLFFPQLIGGFGLLWWFLPIFIDRHFRTQLGVKAIRRKFRYFFQKPFLVRDTEINIPILRHISEPCIILQMRSKKKSLSEGNWIWAAACYLLEKGIILYNGLPATEVSRQRLFFPVKIPIFEFNEHLE